MDMFHYEPPERPSLFLQALSMIDQDADGFYVDAFAHTLDVLARNKLQAFAPYQVASVVNAWGDYESDNWSGGFVVQLSDGRRLYIESAAVGDWEPGSAAQLVTSVPADANTPDGLERFHGAEVYGWRRELPEVVEYLARLAEIHVEESPRRTAEG